MKSPFVLFLALGLSLLGLSPSPAADAPGQIESDAPPVVSLAANEVTSLALFLFYKPTTPLQTKLEISLSPTKQTEIAQLLEKKPVSKIEISTDGKVVGEMALATGAKPHSIMLNFSQPEEAWALAKALVPKPLIAPNAWSPGQTLASPNALTFALSSQDISKVVVLMSATGPLKLEVTFPKNKQEEVAKTAQESARDGKKIQISLNGKVVGLRDPFPALPAGEVPHVGHSLKVSYAFPDDAFAMARELIEKKAP